MISPLLVTILLLGEAAQPHDLPAPDSDDPEGQQLAAFVISGFKGSRDRLRSGVFRARGYLNEIENSADREPVEAEFEIFSAFDFDRNLVRFDRQTEKTVGSGDKRRTQQTGGKFVRTNEYTIQWILPDQQAWIYAPEKEATPLIAPFDVRLLGLTNWATLDSYGEHWQDALAMLDLPVDHASAETESLYRLTWIHEKVKSRTDCILDAQQGFCPVRFELGPIRAEGRLSKLKEIDQATWKSINDVWVPTSFSEDRKKPMPGRREWSFQWESVNEPVDDSLFTWQGMDLAKSTRVVEGRMGKPGFVVGVVGTPELRPKRPPEKPRPAWTFGRLLAVGLGGVVFVVLLLLLGASVLRRSGRLPRRRHPS